MSSQCCGGTRLIFACSGASDVGALSDLAARKLSKEAVGRMFCLAGIGGRVSGIMKTTEAADAILVIDGCPLECAKNCLLQAGFTKFEHIQLAQLGMEKGKSPVSDDAVARVVAKGRELLANAIPSGEYHG